MKFVIYPAFEPERLKAMQAAAPGAEWVNAATVEEAEAAMPGADALLGKIMPGMLRAPIAWPGSRPSPPGWSITCSQPSRLILVC